MQGVILLEDPNVPKKLARTKIQKSPILKKQIAIKWTFHIKYWQYWVSIPKYNSALYTNNNCYKNTRAMHGRKSLTSFFILHHHQKIYFVSKERNVQLLIFHFT